MYNLNNRDEITEMKARYDAMVNTLSTILDCGIWDIEELFDSENNIVVGNIVTHYVKELGFLPSWNDVYREAMLEFATKYDLQFETDVDIYTNCCLDTHIYYREDLDSEIVEEMESLFNMTAEEM